FATGNLDGDIVQRFHLEGIAFEHLADISRLDDPGLSSDISCSSSAHDCPLILILFPSFKSCGPEVITSSPPFKPCTRRPPLRCEIIRTWRISAFPLKAMKTTFFPARCRVRPGYHAGRQAQQLALVGPLQPGWRTAT